MENGQHAAFGAASEVWHQLGLTKREYFAGLAMQCVFSFALKNELPNGLFQTAEIDAVKMADALLVELERTKEK